MSDFDKAKSKILNEQRKFKKAAELWDWTLIDDVQDVAMENILHTYFTADITDAEREELFKTLNNLQ